MDEDFRRSARNNCETRGIDWAKAAVGTMTAGDIPLYTQEWINEYERRDRDDREAELKRLSEDAVIAAKQSSETSRDAAVASRKSANWTMWAAIAAAASAFISLAQALGCFGPGK